MTDSLVYCRYLLWVVALAASEHQSRLNSKAQQLMFVKREHLTQETMSCIYGLMSSKI